MTFSKEEKQKIYALYCGCQIAYPSDDFINSKWIPGRWSWSVVADTNYSVENTRLVLKPLSRISDEDALLCADNLGVDIYFKGTSKLVPEELRVQKVKECLFNHIHDFVAINEIVGIIDFLRSKGYALPYQGIDLFEAGVAITSKTN